MDESKYLIDILDLSDTEDVLGAHTPPGETPAIIKRRITMQHRITNQYDVRKLQKYYDCDVIFEVIETGEETTLADLLYHADWNDFEAVTIKYCEQEFEAGLYGMNE